MTRTLLTALALVAAAPLAGQDIGLHFGFARTSVSVPDDDEALPEELVSPQINYRAGVSLGIPLAEAVSIRTGAFYSRRSINIELRIPDFEDGTIGRADIRPHFEYLEVPLMLRADMPTEGINTIHVLAGPVLGFHLSCTAEADTPELTISTQCEQLELDPRSLDLGIAVGTGIAIGLGAGTSLVVDAIYTQGLLGFDEDGDVKHNAFVGQAGLAFPIG